MAYLLGFVSAVALLLGKVILRECVGYVRVCGLGHSYERWRMFLERRLREGGEVVSVFGFGHCIDNSVSPSKIEYEEHGGGRGHKQSHRIVTPLAAPLCSTTDQKPANVQIWLLKFGVFKLLIYPFARG